MADSLPESIGSRPPATRVGQLAFLAKPEHLNTMGTVHGGILLNLADETGAQAAWRYAGGDRMVTAGFDSFQFLTPIPLAHRVEAIAEVSGVGRKWIEARIEVYVEEMDGNHRQLAGYGYAVYVSLDVEGRPREVPPLLVCDEADRQRDEAAQQRQAIRKGRLEEARHHAEVVRSMAAPDHRTTS